MRSTLFITAAAILLTTYLWLDDPIESQEPQDRVRSTTPASTSAVPKARPPFQPFSTLPPSSDPPPGLSNPYPRDQAHLTPSPSTPPAANPPAPRIAAPPIPVDPRWEEIASRPTLTHAKPIYINVASSQPDRDFEDDDTRWKRGTLTLQGSFSYYPLYNPSLTAMARVTLAASMNCEHAKGILYYRDLTQQVEWLSSEFSFDAQTTCATEQEQLNELSTRFNADISGVYIPLIFPLTGSHFGIAPQSGLFNLRFVSGELTNVSQSAVKICLVFQDGAYVDYRLPQNPQNWSVMPQCTFLNSFTLQRNL